MVLLEGGPSRSFSADDAAIFSEDLTAIKEFFMDRDLETGTALGVDAGSL